MGLPGKENQDYVPLDTSNWEKVTVCSDLFYPENPPAPAEWFEVILPPNAPLKPFDMGSRACLGAVDEQGMVFKISAISLSNPELDTAVYLGCSAGNLVIYHKYVQTEQFLYLLEMKSNANANFNKYAFFEKAEVFSASFKRLDRAPSS
jgi:hypothetical protein